jgi:membrane-bound metal-dependent hydrolase YbcI (DUF457 family)
MSPLLLVFKIKQTLSFKNILSASLSGIYIHILLDSMTHSDIRPFYPLDLNPFLGIASVLGVYMLCIWSFIGGVITYTIKFFRSWRK